MAKCVSPSPQSAAISLFCRISAEFSAEPLRQNLRPFRAVRYGDFGSSTSSTGSNQIPEPRESGAVFAIFDVNPRLKPRTERRHRALGTLYETLILKHSSLHFNHKPFGWRILCRLSRHRPFVFQFITHFFFVSGVHKRRNRPPRRSLHLPRQMCRNGRSSPDPAVSARRSPLDAITILLRGRRVNCGQ
jgi:hypothetical protein